MRHRRAVPVAMALAVLTGGAFLAGSNDGALAAPITGTTTPPPSSKCPGETYPAAGIPRDSNKSTPYGIPFSATLAGGYLQVVGPLLTLTLGYPLTPQANGSETGHITGNACGVVYLPGESGTVTANPPGAPGNNFADQYNNNFQFNNAGLVVGISVTGTGGTVPVIEDSQGSADGTLQAVFEKSPAANGGINVNFDGAAKATADIQPADLVTALSGITLPPSLSGLLSGLSGTTGGECTLVIGDLKETGMPASDLAVPAGSSVSPVTGLTYAQETTAVKLTTGESSGVDPSTGKTVTMYGQPVTGPITAARATLVSNDFPVAKIDPNTPPSPDAPDASATPDTLCTPAFANILNMLVGLPTGVTHSVFSAPGTFAIHTTK